MKNPTTKSIEFHKSTRTVLKYKFENNPKSFKEDRATKSDTKKILENSTANVQNSSFFLLLPFLSISFSLTIILFSIKSRFYAIIVLLSWCDGLDSCVHIWWEYRPIASPKRPTKPTVAIWIAMSESRDTTLFVTAFSEFSGFNDDLFCSLSSLSEETLAVVYSLASATGNHLTAHGDPWLFNKVACNMYNKRKNGCD